MLIAASESELYLTLQYELHMCIWKNLRSRLRFKGHSRELSGVFEALSLTDVTLKILCTRDKWSSEVESYSWQLKLFWAVEVILVYHSIWVGE